MLDRGHAQFHPAHNSIPIISLLNQFQPDLFPLESFPTGSILTLFVHTKYCYTDKNENNLLCTPNIFIQISMKLTFCAHKIFYTAKIETNFSCTKVIRVGIDQVVIDRVRMDQVRNDRGLEMIGSPL